MKAFQIQQHLHRILLHLKVDTDKAEDSDASSMMDDAIELATKRYTDAGYSASAEYILAIEYIERC